MNATATNLETSAVRVVRSAVWAAYGDALGFISELATGAQLRKRVHSSTVRSLAKWRRRVGGKFGVDVDLPLGTYSDDTQLRLATCRAIRGNGVFDVEAFAKVELPVWTAYALGAGISSKVAAGALARREITWVTNFFSSERRRYVDGGGNGAAMRIQPHVWASPRERSEDELILDVLRNALVTHGHPNGLIGAVVHAIVLRAALRDERIASPAQLDLICSTLPRLPEIMQADEQIRTLWFPMWERQAGRTFAAAFQASVDEFRSDVETLMRIVRDRTDPARAYFDLLNALGGFDETTRGSGAKCAIFSSVLAWLFESAPGDGMVTCANALGSDTDTIATMTGALLGVVAHVSPTNVLDYRYIGAEAKRMHDISVGRAAKSFEYPDLIHWEAPKTQLEAVRHDAGRASLAGLGTLQPVGEAVAATKDAYWQWFSLPFGQTVLLKQRVPSDVRDSLEGADASEQTTNVPTTQQSLMLGTEPRRPSIDRPRPDLAHLAAVVRSTNYNPKVFGDLIIDLLTRDEPEEAITLVAHVSKLIKEDRRR